MDRARAMAALPYAILLAASLLFFGLAGNIRYAPQPGQIGPDLWPKFALGLIAIVSLVEIARALLGRHGEVRGVVDALEKEEEEEVAVPRRPALLLAGAGLSILYGMLIPFLGFPLATFGFLVAFMYVGAYRTHLAIWVASAIGALAISSLFLNVVYVSLPRGVPPFDRVTDFIVNLF
jgi:hypothetical protein